MIKIALDPGHGLDSKNGGQGMTEYEFNSAVAGYAQKLLTEAGYEVVLTQPLHANTVSLSERLNIAIKNDVDLLISIHADYNKSPNPRGFWGFYWHESEKGKQFAEIWERHATKHFPHPARGLRECNLGKWPNFYMTRETHRAGIPAILIEHGFMSNPEDLKILKSDSFRQIAAITIVDAVNEMFGVQVDWRVEIGKNALNELVDRGLVANPEQIENLYKPLPAWFQLEMFNRIVKLSESS
ncbi:N-acetylmuramoyl-L-alanine amidase [Clostridium sp. 'deep sea']|uniref:N-acetylmuramoyl-L-alanine amidase family protein n=1 Tax=Clostridium sp. 'deep sea' TaxID=2779445 RepID=UPI00189691F2|nr:N-acetylmuramoyl-L-alanine amidase [Clostridium sp. 'deep sea']QOR34449.1 N-acetylmuramoyl-L-alanine amidase [Clostridium sp. 'deep sea']